MRATRDSQAIVLEGIRAAARALGGDEEDGQEETPVLRAFHAIARPPRAACVFFFFFFFACLNLSNPTSRRETLSLSLSHSAGRRRVKKTRERLS